VKKDERGRQCENSDNVDIRFESIVFSYGKKTVFDGFDLRIPKGKMTALVGPSGYGKSTIADLLLRLYEPMEGRILIGDRPLNCISIEEWRSRIGFVSQDVFIFNASVSENIALGKLDASREEIIDAARNAEAHAFILELPEGYDTVIGERGLTLSGGQRQRLAIARAIIRDPQFLILDEATSALDMETEKAIQKSIERIGRHKTMLVIAHRLTTIENADVVYDLGVLNKNQAINRKKVMVS